MTKVLFFTLKLYHVKCQVLDFSTVLFLLADTLLLLFLLCTLVSHTPPKRGQEVSGYSVGNADF